ncbi:MAG: acylneuraminate cytidylyltransferase family protein [Candidatus Ratteibacteria bacterium]|nr:acylneuraminate cytidylyltransferase family protein [Candidatus Ratteibacteria bacterium]
MIVAVIPARGGSKGIPKKNIIDFCGKPLIAWSILQSKNSELIDEVYVSSDDDEIIDISSSYGAKVIHRPGELATDFSTSEESLLHTVSIIEKKVDIDLIVFLQATSPLREKKDIGEAITEFRIQKVDSLFSAARLEDFFIWEKTSKGLKSMNYDYKNRTRRQDTGKQYVENGSIYIFKPFILKKYNNRLGGRIGIYEMELWKTREIDSIEDKELCEWYFNKKILKSMGNHDTP